MAEYFPNLGKETNIQVQEEQKVPNKVYSKRSTSIYSIIKMEKFKERILNSVREGEINMVK